MSGRPRFGTVVFDCDATLSAITGIEELSREQRSEVERLTDSAMSGQLSLEQIYARRLALARPNRARVEDLGRLYVERLVPDAREVVAALSENQVEVRIASSGVRPDLETRPIVDFVAFAGVSARPAVMAGADVVIRDFSLAPVLSLALDRPPEHEPARSL